MTAGTVILWRHGQTDYNITGRVQGGTDIALNEVGHGQAARGSRGIMSYLDPVRPAAIIASDLVRAAATAQALADVTGQRVVTDARLRERCFGLFEGRTREELLAEWPDLFAQWTSGGTPAGTGMETRGEVAERVVQAVLEHAGRLEHHDVLVVVGHGSATTQAMTRLLGLDPDVSAPLRGLDNCHWSTLNRVSHGSPEWRLRAHNVGWAV